MCIARNNYNKPFSVGTALFRFAIICCVSSHRLKKFLCYKLQLLLDRKPKESPTQINELIIFLMYREEVFQKFVDTSLLCINVRRENSFETSATLILYSD